MKFQEFNFHPKVAAGVAAAGYTTPTPIQARAIQAVMAGSDVMGLSQTGTGKTAAFALPILNRLLNGKRRQVRAIERVLGSSIERRTVDGFDYGLPAPQRESQPNRRPRPLRATSSQRGGDLRRRHI